ncbi:FecR family protein [uncultured Chitinophaga sp.]|uniref:FecR family protein n=1 Tax=uncultured Chitinophaga sp. TaxID=339340 RepID=UPI0025F1F642|nr:FecR family protein [uncultured Chitinophaga sp.]
MDIEQIKRVLDRYTQGKCTPDEVKTIEQWFASINQHQTKLIDDDFLQAQLEEVRLRIHENMQAPVKPRRNKIRTLLYSGLAAAVIAGVAFTAYRFMDVKPNNLTGTINKTRSSKTIKDGYVEVVTTKGATERIVLSDGSTVVVNASSKLRYPVKFGTSDRSIILEEGEAFFKVASDPARPFTVHTAELSTTALGTSFNIRAYSHENKVVVALLTGKVKVEEQAKKNSNEAPVILMPQEQLSYNRKSLSMIKSMFGKQDDIVGWKHGFLVFKDASYNEVITEIENRYDVTVINQTEKTAWNYTGFFKDESLQDVIETICLTKGISYSIKNDTIFLQSKN